MRTLIEIDRHPNVPHSGKIICRDAVRGIILRGEELLMIHSKVEGDYKFPGGGVEPGEPHEATLKREIAEEAGAQLQSIVCCFGKTVEYDFPMEKHYDAFCMSSFYYVCKIDPTLGNQTLEAYEAALGFTPEWISIDEAIENNRKLLNNPNQKLQRWVRRETEVLNQIKNELHFLIKATH